MKVLKQIRLQRARRTFRVRNAVQRAAQGRPRLSVFRSNDHIYAQVIDDANGRTLCSASTREKGACEGYGGNAAAAAAIGKLIGERALGLGVKAVVFDRGPYKYHGRVASLADAARAAGLEF